jgi:GNAT superfamily N-acetyltransferase
MFVDPPYRSTGAADQLLCAIEKLAEDRGCRCLVSLARQGSAYDMMLGRRSGYTRTHAQHTKWLNGYEGGWHV